MSEKSENLEGKTKKKGDNPHSSPSPSHLSDLPAVDKLLSDPRVEGLIDRYSRKLVKEAVRDAISVTRNQIKAGDTEIEVSEPSLISIIEEWVIKTTMPKLKPVINATGIILHTNLGRAPLGHEVLENVVKVASGYSNLEFDLKEGKRGERYDNFLDLISDITGAESAIIVNNNAAAVLLSLDSLASGGEVIVSRGELVEIGGGFRIPDVMEKSGARLKEVGTTNRTRLEDYENAITPDTALILKVHTSNYRIVGFSEDVPASELTKLGKKKKIPVMEDLGSGCLIDLSRFGLPHEPTVTEVVKSGVDIVTFSGDKLLGGGQAGFIIGKNKFIKKISENPLNRAFRIDKLTLASIEATLLIYQDIERAITKIPTLSMITMPYEETKKRAKRIIKKINSVPHPGFDVVSADDFSKAGGGAIPTAEIPTRVVTILPLDISTSKLEEQLRGLELPIIVRIAHERVIIDPRTVNEKEIPIMIDGVLSVIGDGVN